MLGLGPVLLLQEPWGKGRDVGEEPSSVNRNLAGGQDR